MEGVDANVCNTQESMNVWMNVGLRRDGSKANCTLERSHLGRDPVHQNASKMPISLEFYCHPPSTWAGSDLRGPYHDDRRCPQWDGI